MNCVFLCRFFHLWIWSSGTDICCLLLALYTNLCDKVFSWIWHSYLTRLADQWATRLPQSQPLYEFSFMCAFYVIARDTNSGSQDCKGSTLNTVLCLQHCACNPSIKIQLDAKGILQHRLKVVCWAVTSLKGKQRQPHKTVLIQQGAFHEYLLSLMNILFASWIFTLLLLVSGSKNSSSWSKNQQYSGLMLKYYLIPRWECKPTRSSQGCSK